MGFIIHPILKVWSEDFPSFGFSSEISLTPPLLERRVRVELRGSDDFTRK